MDCLVKRIHSNDEGTFGVLILNDEPIALTAERPWLYNARSISCIPKGKYICKRIKSPSHGGCFEITNVPGRTHILIHGGNFPLKDSEGCILVGEQFERINGVMAVAQSKKGYGEFMDKQKGVNEFTLEIRDIF